MTWRAGTASEVVAHALHKTAPIASLFAALPRVLARLNAGEKPPVEAWDREQKNLLARGQLISTDNQIDVATGIEVTDTVAALGAVARWARTRIAGPVIGITGSVGKTSTKDLIGALLFRFNLLKAA